MGAGGQISPDELHIGREEAAIRGIRTAVVEHAPAGPDIEVAGEIGESAWEGPDVMGVGVTARSKPADSNLLPLASAGRGACPRAPLLDLLRRHDPRASLGDGFPWAATVDRLAGGTPTTTRSSMADVEKNLRVWRSWDWSRAGDEWSDWCGGTEAMWHGTLMPRIHRFLPAGTILEIAPGYGRWTQFLKEHCERLVLVDLAENCIAHCRERFAGEDHIAYHVNDGRSLAMVEDESVDLAFSFDSLVHADLDVLASYLDQLARKLKRDGVGFI